MQTYPFFAGASSALGMVVLAKSGSSVAFAVSGQLVSIPERDLTRVCRLGAARVKQERKTECQEASSQVMAKITGTESSVATKMVSRAKITPRS